MSPEDVSVSAALWVPGTLWGAVGSINGARWEWQPRTGVRKVLIGASLIFGSSSNIWRPLSPLPGSSFSKLCFPKTSNLESSDPFILRHVCVPLKAWAEQFRNVEWSVNQRHRLLWSGLDASIMTPRRTAQEGYWEIAQATCLLQSWWWGLGQCYRIWHCPFSMLTTADVLLLLRRFQSQKFGLHSSANFRTWFPWIQIKELRKGCRDYLTHPSIQLKLSPTSPTDFTYNLFKKKKKEYLVLFCWEEISSIQT